MGVPESRGPICLRAESALLTAGASDMYYASKMCSCKGHTLPLPSTMPNQSHDAGFRAT